MKIFRSAYTVFILSFVFGICSAKAAVDIAAAPLQTGTAVAPNIYYVLDDSRSMQWEIMPDEYVYIGSSIYGQLFPYISGLYNNSGNSFSSYIPRFSDDNIHNVIKRSSQVNKIFYDPKLTYVPWVKADGSSFGNASPTAALWDPATPSVGSINLTNEQNYNRWYRHSSNLNSREQDTNSRNYWPMTFFVYKGTGSELDISSYHGYQIQGSTAKKKDMNGGSWTTITSFSWVSGSTTINRSVTEERQNFANWFSYYRSRISAARAGTSIAFSELSDDYRIGFTTLATSRDSSNTKEIPLPSLANIEKGTFTGGNKTSWYDLLFSVKMNNPSGTPLRNSLKWAGDEYSKTGSTGPWGPGDSLDQISCRQSFTILTTDGYYNGSSPSVGNSDNTPGDLIEHPSGETDRHYKYEPIDPYKDSHSNTLADVAMEYWKNDLRPNLDNNVPVSSANPAFWQHMVTYGVSIGVKGNKDPAVDEPGSWADPQGSNGAKIDDLWHAAINGRGEFIPASKPDEFTSALSTALSSISERVGTASNLAGSTITLESGTGVFQGKFDSRDWSGDVVALDPDDSSSQSWSAAQKLKTRDPSSREIYYASSATEAKVFNTANISSGVLSADTVNYLRGDQTKELRNGGSFRNRTSVLGDIANSNPLLVEGVVNRLYENYSWGSGYESYFNSMRDRPATLYVGANDGMLHAFNANTGDERFAFMPKAVIPAVAELTQPNYIHRYFVDGSPVVADIKTTSWKTVLLGSLGRGGNTLFALDITDPTSFNTSDFMWEQSYDALGQTTSKPLIARLKNGKWVAVIGYGYNNTRSTRGGLLVIDIVNNGNVLWQIDLPASVATDNGIGQIEGWDADGDGNLDWVFGGDLHGNIWKFDLSVTDPQTNGVAYGGTPLFKAVSAAGVKQPVTGGVTLAKHPKTGELWLYFGTGKMLSDADPINTEQQSWYGIKDGSPISDRNTQLLKRDMYNVTSEDRVIEDAPLDDMATKRGWVIDLADSRERITETPQIRSVNLGYTRSTGLVVASQVPNSDFCNPASDGWVMAINPFTGGRLVVHYFDRSGDGLFDEGDSVTDPVSGEDGVVSGVKFDGMSGDALIIREELITTGGPDDTNLININSGVVSGRVSWREMSN